MAWFNFWRKKKEEQTEIKEDVKITTAPSSADLLTCSHCNLPIEGKHRTLRANNFEYFLHKKCLKQMINKVKNTGMM